VSAPKVEPAPAGMSGKWNHARFRRACERVGIKSAADLARFVNAADSKPAHHPNASATAVVLAYFAAHPRALAKPRDASAAWPAGRVAVQQAMHRFAVTGYLVREAGGAYRLRSAKPPFVVAASLASKALTPAAAHRYWTGEADPTRGRPGLPAAAFSIAVALNVSLDWLVSEDPQ
jgi:hypothetical protein